MARIHVFWGEGSSHTHTHDRSGISQRHILDGWCREVKWEIGIQPVERVYLDTVVVVSTTVGGDLWQGGSLLPPVAMVVCCGCLMSGPVLKNRSSRLYIDIFLLPRLFCKACDDVYKKRGTQRVGTFSFIKCLWYEMEVLPEARNARSKKATHQWYSTVWKKKSFPTSHPSLLLHLPLSLRKNVRRELYMNTRKPNWIRARNNGKLPLSLSLSFKTRCTFFTHTTHMFAQVWV